MDKANLLKIATGLAKQSEDYTALRIAQVMENEDLYYNKVSPALPGLYNTPIPVMGGFIDTLVSKISGKTVIKFNKQNNSDSRKAKKVSAMWEKDSAPDRGNWHEKDILSKKNAAFCGRAILKLFGESDPEYKCTLEVIHYKDFICEPKGGYDLETHLYVGQKNIFKSKKQIEAGIEKGIYEKDALELFTNEREKTYSDSNTQKNNTKDILGLQTNEIIYSPENVANLYELFISTDEGRYYILFSYEKQKVVRWGLWKDIQKFSDDWCYFSWATHPELDNFWSKSASDDLRPISYSINTLMSQGMNNIQKRNHPQRAVDSKMFTDPTQLIYGQDSLIPVNSFGSNIANGVYEFQTPDNTQITMSLINFLDGMGGLKTGVTNSVQGEANEKAVGIYYGNMEQIANRFGPMSTYYTNCWVKIGKAYLNILKTHMHERQMVKMLGVDGIKWEEIMKEDLKTKDDLSINITATNQEAQLKEAEIKTKTQAMAMLTNNPAYTNQLNPKWIIKETLKMGGFDDDEITQALDVNNTTSEEQLEIAAEALEDIVEGKKPKLNLHADTGFITKLVDSAIDLKFDADKMAIVYAYAMSHVQIAARNTMLRASTLPTAPTNGLSTNNVPGITTMNIPNPEQGNVQERSQALTNQNTI